MDFYRFREIPTRRSGDVTCRYPVGPAFLVPLVLAGAMATLYLDVGPAAAIFAGLPRVTGWVWGGGALGMALIGLWMLAGRMSPRVAWLARMADEGLVVKFRSPLNHRSLAAADVVAFRVPWHEIRSVSHTREASAGPGRRGKRREERIPYLDLKLDSDDVLPLRMHLSRERSREPALLRRWWGGRTRRDVAPHHPVGLMAEGVLRLEWKVRPGAGRALEILRDRVAAVRPKAAAPDAVAEEALPLEGTEVLEPIAALIRSGETIGAVIAATDAFGLSDADAQRLVEALSVGKVTPDDPQAVTAFLVKPVSREQLLGMVERANISAVRNVLVAHYGFSSREAGEIGAALRDLPPDQGRKHLASRLEKGPARSLP